MTRLTLSISTSLSLLAATLCSCAKSQPEEAPEPSAPLPELPAPKAAPTPAPTPKKKQKKAPAKTVGFVDPDTTALMKKEDRKTVVIPDISLNEVPLPSQEEENASPVTASTPGSLDDLGIPE